MSTAFDAEAAAAGGFSSASTRARPASAGAQRASACSASCIERSASGRLYFSRNSRPHPVSIAGSSDAADAARNREFASRALPSARAARAARNRDSTSVREERSEEHTSELQSQS